MHRRRRRWRLHRQLLRLRRQMCVATACGVPTARCISSAVRGVSAARSVSAAFCGPTAARCIATAACSVSTAGCVASADCSISAAFCGAAATRRVASSACSISAAARSVATAACRGLLLIDLEPRDSLAGAAAYCRSVRIEGIGRAGKEREETLEIRSLNNARAARARKGKAADLGFRPVTVVRVE